MLQAARRAPNLLLEAADRVVAFLRGQLNEDGGGKDRAGRSDLYYTVFVLESLLALGVDVPFERILRYLGTFDDGSGLDLVHQACLARCWAAMPAGATDADRADRFLQNIESHRAADGGYNAQPGAQHSGAYHCMLALGAYQDLGRELPCLPCRARHRQAIPNRLVSCLEGLRTGDGAYANEPGLQFGTTPATAAAVALMRQLDAPVPPGVGDWLMARCHQQGGFLATPQAPFPDLLSTATALHALAGMGIAHNVDKELCLDFLDTLWTGQAFCGHWADDKADSEYTFYALLALGHLST